MAVNNFPRRGEIWLVRLDPAVGSEIKKTRPALVISNNFSNQYSATISVLPISDPGEKVYPFEVRLAPEGAGLSKASKIKCQQIRTIDKSRLIKLLGEVDIQVISKIEQALQIHLGFEKPTD